MMDSAETCDQRLERLERWCVTGRAAAAELELTGWRRAKHCPAGARVLLASLRARRGELRDAREALGPTRDLDPRSLSPEQAKMLVAVDTLLGDEAEAAYVTRGLHHAHGQDEAVGRWLAVSDPPGMSELPDQTPAKADRLADALWARFELVPTLVFAQEQRPSSGALSLLRSALLRLAARAADDTEKQLTVCRALAQVAQLLGDEDEARRWAHRGLKIDPYCARLALVLSWVPDDAAVGEPAVDVLARVSSVHPQYPDVAAALERRREQDDRPDELRRAA